MEAHPVIETGMISLRERDNELARPLIRGKHFDTSFS